MIARERGERRVHRHRRAAPGLRRAPQRSPRAIAISTSGAARRSAAGDGDTAPRLADQRGRGRYDAGRARPRDERLGRRFTVPAASGLPRRAPRRQPAGSASPARPSRCDAPRRENALSTKRNQPRSIIAEHAPAAGERDADRRRCGRSAGPGSADPRRRSAAPAAASALAAAAAAAASISRSRAATISTVALARGRSPSAERPARCVRRRACRAAETAAPAVATLPSAPPDHAAAVRRSVCSKATLSHQWTFSSVVHSAGRAPRRCASCASSDRDR